MPGWNTFIFKRNINNILPYVIMLFIQLLTLHSQKRSNKVHKYIYTQCILKGWKITWGEHRNGNSWREQACSCSVWHVTVWLNSSAPLCSFLCFHRCLLLVVLGRSLNIRQSDMRKEVDSPRHHLPRVSSRLTSHSVDPTRAQSVLPPPRFLHLSHWSHKPDSLSYLMGSIKETVLGMES